ncbi:MAG: VOC family protein [Bacteroidota bacterium]
MRIQTEYFRFLLLLVANYNCALAQTDTTSKDIIMKGLRTTIYKVNDIYSAKEWYSKAFNTTPYFDEPFYVGFNIGGYELGLQPESIPPKEKTKNVISYWGTDNIQETYSFLLSIGAKDNEAPSNVGGDIMTASVIDLWGNIIGLIYNPEFRVEE